MEAKTLRWTLLATAVLVSVPGFAGDFDGSKNLICASVEVRDCMPGMGCLQGTPGDTGAPAFMRIDFNKKTVSGPRRTSPIEALENEEHQLLLRGRELGHGWIMALDRESGRMAVSLVDRSGAFVIFGSCTPL
ncbi:hypothetical protein [Aromatoleum sp.]|uniref:hypothetical protein n=1 Tax=Aromatoleum sp. TaxID=2307007 RepID=UPI002FC5B32A